MLRTTKQRKTLCATCPVARVADLLGDSCSILIVRDLLVRGRRFSDLQKSLEGISTRTLTKKLKLLEKEGVIIRKESNEGPHCVEYKLTKKGAALSAVLEAMQKYGKKYL